MEYVSIDLHKKESQICLLTETGEVICTERRGELSDHPRHAVQYRGRWPCARSLDRPRPRQIPLTASARL